MVRRCGVMRRPRDVSSACRRPGISVRGNGIRWILFSNLESQLQLYYKNCSTQARRISSLGPGLLRSSKWMAFCKHLFTARKRRGLIIPMTTVARVLSAEGCGSLGGGLTRRFGALGSFFLRVMFLLVRSRTPGSSAYSIELLRARSRQPEKVRGAA